MIYYNIKDKKIQMIKKIVIGVIIAITIFVFIYFVILPSTTSTLVSKYDLISKSSSFLNKESKCLFKTPIAC